MARADHEQVPGMADAVESRRRELGLGIQDFVDRADLTREQIYKIRKGHKVPYAQVTIEGVAVALEWPLDWYDQLARGNRPGDEPPPAAVRRAVLNRRMARIRQKLDNVTAQLDELGE